jgi:adenylate kinase family enzyme
MCGPNASGKTTLAQAIINKFPNLNYVNGDHLRKMITADVAYFKNVDYSVRSPEENIANHFAKMYINGMTDELGRAGQSILVDAVSLRSDTRKFRFDQVRAHNPNIVKIIIGMNIPEEELIKNLSERDRQGTVNHPLTSSNWLKVYNEYGKQTYQLPTPQEADHVLIFNQENQEEILQDLEKIIQ